MKIFIIGYSGIGKSPFAKKILKEFPNSQHISGGEWVRSQCPVNATVDELTKFSKEQLNNNPNSCIDFIKSKYIFDNNISIIEGIRNPYDFNRLFDYQKDIVVFLSRSGLIYRTSFENNGILAIKAYVNFLNSEKFTSENRILNIHFSNKNKYSTDMVIEIPKNSLVVADLEDAIPHLVNMISGGAPPIS